MDMENNQFDIHTHQFDVAFSFSGKHRRYVENVVNSLIKTYKIERGKIFYDKFYTPFLLRALSDVQLQDIYRKRSKLLVVFLGEDYQKKEWPSVEARAIRDLIQKKQDDKIMLFRFDDGEVDGFFSGDFALDVRNYKPAYIASLVHQRMTNTPTFQVSADTAATSRGHALPVSNLPEKNPHFIGRNDILQKIEAVFKSGGRVYLKQTIAGLGGVGKTQLALEYAYRHKKKYPDAVWWVNAETGMAAFNDCLDFAQKFGFLQEGEDEALKLTPAKLGEQLKNWFMSHRSWLFIFDNVEQIGIVEPYILGVQTGHVLMTTRTRDLAQGESVDIDLFTPEDAMNFMRARLSKYQGLIDKETALVTLTKRLDYFPLALEQAAAYMESAQIRCSDYLGYLNKDGLKVLKSKRGKPANYPRIITETLALSFNKLSRGARQLFDLCAYMSPEKIPLFFFERQRELLPQPLGKDMGDTYKLNDIVAELLNYSLIKRTGNLLNIHRLVQEIGRGLLDGGKTDWLNICVKAAIAEMPTDEGFTNQEQRERFEQIASHGAVMADYATQDTYADTLDKKKLAGDLCYHMGLGYYYSAKYENALTWYCRALEKYETALGRECPKAGNTYNNMGTVCYRQGNYDKALELYQKALGIYGKAPDENLLDTAFTYNNIAQLYSIWKDYSKALEWNHKALEIREKELGKKSTDTAITYNDIGLVHARKGNYIEAKGWYHKALEIYETANPSYAAATCHNIGKAYAYKGDYNEAMAWHRKALEIREKVNGKEHTYTAESYHDIGEVYASQGNDAEALKWHNKALKIRIKKLGKEHPQTVSTYNSIAEIHSRQK